MYAEELLKEFRVPHELTLTYHKSLSDTELKLSSDPLLMDLFRVILALHILERTGENVEELSFRTPYAEKFKSIAEELESLYDFLTGISVSLHFEKTSSSVQHHFSDPESGREALLFSGGLDSFCGAIDAPSKVVLVHGILNNIVYGRSRDLRMSCPVLQEMPMISCRCVYEGLGGGISQTRGLLFLTLAGLVCSTIGAKHVVLAENGPLMLNPETSPLSVPTKNCHPTLVTSVESILTKLTGESLRIVCPYKDKTKAEILASVPKRFQRWFRYTNSCSSTRLTKMCGLCFGCFVRRLSLAALDYSEDDKYAYDVFSIDLLQLGDQRISRVKDLRQSLRFFSRFVRNDTATIGTNDFFEDQTSMLRRFGLDLTLGMDNLFKLHRSYGTQNSFGRYCVKLVSGMHRELIDQRRSELYQVLDARY